MPLASGRACESMTPAGPSSKNVAGAVVVRRPVVYATATTGYPLLSGTAEQVIPCACRLRAR
ncbi:hypothetical protein [Streptomyces sp. NPDC017448]|uniref:hypothetical protein n=1 Tax=Streptomyces sp. NPDC017448 TaxID=3364996 RepID=UPI0037B97DE8